MSLPTDAKQRKSVPIASGVLDYFPDAIAAIAELSRIGNDQHNPGKPLHWDRSKSTDHDDCLIRHFMERGSLDTDRVRHRTKVAWRALASLQTEIEEEKANHPAAIYRENLERHLKQNHDVVECGGCAPPVIASHPMASETLRDEYERDDQGTGV